MNKKAQLTIFIIIGVVLLMVLFISISLSNYRSDENQILSEEIRPINNFVESCLKYISENATWTLTRHGGQISELVYDKIPELSQMESELSEYINANIDFCINDFEVFKKRGFIITQSNHIVETRINQEDITFTLIYPIKLQKQDSVTELDTFVFVYQGISLPYLRNAAIQILEEEEWLNRDLLLSELIKNDAYLDITSYDKYIVYSVSTDKIRFNFGEIVG